MKNQVKVGSFTGTGAAYNLELGFIPSAFIAFNLTDGDIFQAWFNGMTDGYAFQGTNHDTTQHSTATSNGISDYAGEGPNAVLTGTLALTAASGTITGTNTLFLTELKVGDKIKTAAGYEYTVTAIASNTSCTVSPVAVASESGILGVRVTPRSPGVIVGTTLSEAAKVIRYIAIR